jgi:hypothetical protein
MKIKHAYVLVVLFLLCGSKVFSQDIIFFKDGSKDTVVVEEVTDIIVSYKKYSRPEGPVYKILKTEVILIEYSNGTILTIEEPKKTTPKPMRDVPVDWSPNIITANIFGAFIGNAHLAYERLNYEGNFGIRFNIIATLLPKLTDVSMGLAGFDFNFYPAGQKRISYFLGPAFRLGYINYLENNRDETTKFGALLFNNGLAFNPSRHFYFGLQLGTGLGMDKSSQLVPYGYLMFNVGGKL